MDSHQRIWIDNEGHALTMSAHPVDEMVFIPDSEIKRIDNCIDYHVNKIGWGTRLIIGRYQDGTHIIHQPAVRPCVPTCLAMVLLDKNVKLELILEKKTAPFHLSHLVTTNIANNETLTRWANSVGYEIIDLDASISDSVNPLLAIKEAIKTYGPLLVGIDDKEIGGHKIVVDSINVEEVVIRDPAHGWRITIATDFFLQNMKPDFKGLRKKI